MCAYYKENIEVIFRARNLSVLFSDGEPWVKREGDSFDVNMGPYDAAKVFELIDIYMLYLIRKKNN